jgi:tRNA-specific 2-thiouridylase
MKAIALFSGGLDSCLAIKIIQDMGIEIEAVNINTGFESNFEKEEYLKKTAKDLGVKFTSIDIRKQFLDDILFSPRYGYGKNFNPCIDCHANMINVAYDYMKKIGAKFIISGEVLGQRPMSQKIDGLHKIEKLVKEPEIVVRPLSAKLLPLTLPEIKGWINREKMYAISGRERKTQMELAKKFNLKNYESPAGGCLLTDRNFSNKLRDFIKTRKLEVEDIDILKVGRHLIVNDKKVIISRNKDENPILKAYNGDKFLKMFPIGVPGPIGLIESDADEETKKLASRILITYTKADKGIVGINGENIESESFESRDKIKEFMLV